MSTVCGFISLLLLIILSIANTTEFVWVSTEQYWQWRYSHDLSGSYDKTWHAPPSWHEAQLHCQIRFGTNMSSSNDISSMLSQGKRAYFAIRQTLWDKPNNIGSHWIRLDDECPSRRIDDKGHNLCYDTDGWQDDEPNNSWDSEHCGEIDVYGQLNDIICFSVPYGWIQGFGCNLPYDYYVDKEKNIISDKYILQVTDPPIATKYDNQTYDIPHSTISMNMTPTYRLNTTQQDMFSEVTPHDEWNWHIFNIGNVDLFFKDLIIILVVLICIIEFIVCIVIYKMCKNRNKAPLISTYEGSEEEEESEKSSSHSSSITRNSGYSHIGSEAHLNIIHDN